MSQPIGLLSGYSKAMHATWFLYKPDGLLFDCGEGVANALSTKIYSINTVFLSHGHLDHVMGLPGLFFIRSSAKGDNAKPIRIVHPKGDKDIARLREFIEQCFLPPYQLKFPVEWVEAEAGQEIAISPTRTVKAFATRHDDTRATLGYRLTEKRKKLRQELAGTLPGVIRDMVAAGQDIFEDKPRCLFVYTGDTTVQDVPEYDDAEILVHEATFVNKADVRYDSHSALEDVLACLKKYKPKCLVLNHFSARYSPAMCGAATQTKAKELEIDFPVWVHYGEHCWLAHDPADTKTKETTT